MSCLVEQFRKRSFFQCEYAKIGKDLLLPKSYISRSTSTGASGSGFAVSLLAVGDRPKRSRARSILLAMMKSFSCSPLIFLVLRETVT
jgi:hypothetical protein